MRRVLCGLLVLSTIGFVGGYAHAQAQGEAVTRAELIEMLQARDAVIIELQQRLRALEQRLPDAEAAPAPATESLTAPAGPAPDTTDVAVDEPPAPGTLKVDEQAAERALERSLVQEGTLLLPAWATELTPSLVYTQDTADFPATVVTGGVVSLAEANRKRDRLDARADLRLGLPWDIQLEAGMPYRWVWDETEVGVGGGGFSDTESGSSGVGDFQIGLAKGLLREGRWWPATVGRVTWNTGSGTREANDVFLGSGFQSVAGSLSFSARQDPIVFFGSLGYEAIFEEAGLDLGDEYFLRAGTALAISPETSMLFALDGTFTGEAELNGRELDGTDTNQMSLNLGISTILDRNAFLNVTTGIGITEDAPDFSIGVSLPIRFQPLTYVE